MGERILAATVGSAANAPEGINMDATFAFAQVEEGMSSSNDWDWSITVRVTGIGCTKRGGSRHLDEQDPS